MGKIVQDRGSVLERNKHGRAKMNEHRVYLCFRAYHTSLQRHQLRCSKCHRSRNALCDLYHTVSFTSITSQKKAQYQVYPTNICLETVCFFGESNVSRKTDILQITGENPSLGVCSVRMVRPSKRHQCQSDIFGLRELPAGRKVPSKRQMTTWYQLRRQRPCPPPRTKHLLARWP